MNFQKHTRRREKCWRKLDLAGRQLTLLKATKTNEDEDLGYLTFPKTQPKASNLAKPSTEKNIADCRFADSSHLPAMTTYATKSVGVMPFVTMEPVRCF